MKLQNFKEHYISTPLGEIFCRCYGNGTPLLLLHGYPQTHLMWHKTAPSLSDNFTVITADLRGYGDSMVPVSDENHEAYSKRSMAQDMIYVMDFFNFDEFLVAGHDRGGRVAHRMAKDYRDRVKAISVLDICPTLDMYEATDMKFAQSYFHWFFLIQPKGLPEKMIESDPKKWMDQCLNKWSGGHQFGKIEEDYLKSFKQPERIHATCEDYRAAATIDLEHDRLDRDQLLEIPIQVLWGAKGVVGKQFKPKEIWQKYSSYNVGGCAIDSGHFIPEEKPLDTIKELTNFFLSI